MIKLRENMMIYKSKFSVLFFLALMVGFLCMPTFAGDDSRVGTASGTQVVIPVSAREVALGAANLALTAGSNAIHYNPAGLARQTALAEGQFSTMQIFNDISVSYVAVTYNDEDFGAIGLSIKSLGFGDIPLTTNQDMDGESGQTYSPTFVTVGLTYARPLTEAVNLGLTAKLINESVPRASASAFAFDIGLQYDRLGGIDGVSFAVAVKNIGTKMEYTGSGLGYRIQEGSREDILGRPAQSSNLPATVELGLAYTTQVDESNNLLFTGIFENNNLGNDGARFGLEYNYDNFLFARGGYNHTLKVDAEDLLYTWVVGAGIHYPLGGLDFTFDYAYRYSQYFDANNIFTIILGF